MEVLALSSFCRQGRPLQNGRFLQSSVQPRHGIGTESAGVLLLLAKMITP